MANKKDTPKDPPKGIDPDSTDPTLESRVDAMMNSDIPETETASPESPAPEVPVSTGAPLLPTEKLKKIKIFHDESEDEKPPAKDTTDTEQANEDESAEDVAIPQDDDPEAEAAPEEEKLDTKTLVEPEASVETAAEDAREEIPEATKADTAEKLKLDDPETGKLVDEIMAEEADTLLAVEDKPTIQALETPQLLAAHGKPGSKFKAFFRAWFGNPLYRRLTLLVLIIGVGMALVMPDSRYFLLNSAGVRASSSLVVLDQATNQPLRNVEVSLGGQSAKTDKEGKVQLERIKLGAQTLSVRKVAYAENSRELMVGWGSNPLGDIDLTPIGSRYTFSLNDFLSDKPVTRAEATSGEASASSNEKGEVVLSVPQTDDETIGITITADNYRTETLKIPTATKASQQIKLVPARKAVFVSKRSGTYDAYKTDADGKNTERILAGTGSEQPDNMALVSHPDKEVVAFVSSRGNLRNKDGALLHTLNIINIQNNAVTKIGQSERIQVIDWIGDRLVYVKVAEGASDASPQRHRLMSYDLKSEQEKELASTNYFNDVMVARGAVYYSPAIYKINGAIGLFRIDADGTNKKTVFDKEAWNLFRTNFDRISVSVGQDWYDYDIPGSKFARAPGSPPALVSRLYIASPDDSRSLWTEERDGKGTLIAYNHTTKEDKVLHTQSGLKNPVRWLDNDHLMYRVAGGPETADYVMSLSGGQPKKITDVTNTAGTDRWYYY